MKYSRKKITEAILFDGNIEDQEEIKCILTDLKDRRIDVNVQLKDNPKTYSKSRIIGIENDEFSFLFVGNSSLKVKSKISDIEKIEVITNDQVIVNTKSGVNRWHLICPSEDL